MESRRFDTDTVSFSWAAWTDVGKRRTLNEDSMLALPGLFIVADGMGGHGGGDVASTAAVEAMARHGDAPFHIDAVPAMLADARVAVERAAEADQASMMGTTLVTALWIDRGDRPGIVVAHIGDSRCYELGPGGLQLVTQDHSVVQEMIASGDLTETEAEDHPDRHVITRALGGGSAASPDYLVLNPTQPQRLLLCSDGVSGSLDERVLAECLDVSNDAAEAVELIAEWVMGGAAEDNATAIVIDAVWSPAVLATVADMGASTRPHPQRLAQREPNDDSVWRPASDQQPTGGRRR